MSRSEEPEEPTERLNRLEREIVREGSLEMAAIRRLLHGLSNTQTGTDPIAKVDAIITRINDLESEVHHLHAQLRAQHTHRTGTKKEHAKRLARTEVPTPDQDRHEPDR